MSAVAGSIMENIRDLEERVAFAEIARDNALAMRDEAMENAKNKTRRAGEEIARMRLERNEAKDRLRALCEALEAFMASDGAASPASHWKPVSEALEGAQGFLKED